MPRSKELSQLIKDKTGGLLSFLSDYLLLQLLTGLEISTGGYGSRNVYKASERAMEEFLKIKEKQLGDGLKNLKASGYISFAKPGAKPEITKLGKERLERVLPHYEDRRPWDGRMYLISYDIPENERQKRDQLRGMLEKLGCGMFQASIWITPYNPKEVLKDFVFKNHLGGLVIISEVDKDGAIGGENFPDLVYKVFRLEGLENEYRQFLKRCDRGAGDAPRIALDYFLVLKNDPQLPFELLPKNWIGKQAYALFSKLSPLDLNVSRP